MSDIHIVGSDLRIELTILRDGVAPGAVDPLASVVLKYIDPEKTPGSWTPVIDDAEDGTVHYDLAAASNDLVGKYVIWAEATFDGGSKLVTGSATVIIYEAGTPSPA